jgi:DNA-directed RNA polymerase subunit omega
MARVTVEDCLVHISSPFTLTRIAAKRARQLSRGAVPTLPAIDHKYTVTALREIACGHITASILDEADLPLVEQPRFDFEPLDSPR